jgi:hypothetical protein
MVTYARLARAVLVAGFCLLMVGGAAQAREAVEVSATANKIIGSRLSFSGSSGIEVICDVTLTGTLNRTIAKARGALAGSITAISSANCRNNVGGAATVSWLSPLTIGYASISGTLPTITGSSSSLTGGVLISTSVLGSDTRCLYRGTITMSASENPVRTWRVVTPNVARLERTLAGICPGEGELVGTTTLERSLTVTLACRAPPTVAGQITVQALEASDSPPVTINCRTRIRNISTSRPEVIAIADREGAIGREYNTGDRFNYDLRMRDQPGMNTYTDDVVIETSTGNVITRIEFRNL